MHAKNRKRPIDRLDRGGQSSVFLPWISRFLLAGGLILASALIPLDGRTQTVAGVVFVDRDGDGLRGEDESGLGGVLLSDGVQVVRTTAEGTFSFEIQPDPLWPEQHPRVVSLFTPDGHAPSTPWFVRLTGDEVRDRSMAFGVLPQPQEVPFEFVHITDVHYPRNVTAVERFNQEMKDGAERFRFVINTGDIGNLPDRAGPAGARAQLQGGLDAMEALPMPWHATPGNHEVVAAHSTRYGWTPDDPGFGYGLYVDLFGPLRWCFQYGGAAFIGVDTMERLEGDAWRVGPPGSALEWLDAVLEALPTEMPVYLFGHYFHGAAWNERIHGSNIQAVFFGHHHNNKASMRAGVWFLEGGSLSSSNPNGYRILRVDAEEVSHTYVEIGHPRSIIVTDLAIRDGSPPMFSISGYANGFDGANVEIEVTMGTHPIPVTRKPPHPLNIPFTAEADVSAFPAGFHEVIVRAIHGETEASRSQTILNPNGTNPTVTGGATLHVAVFGVDVAAEVFVNGQKVGTLPPHPGGPREAYSPLDEPTSPRFAFDIPDGLLSRLNQIEIRPGEREDGTSDRIWPTYLFLEREEMFFRDLRRRGFGRFFSLRGNQLIDLETPVEDFEAFKTRFLRETSAP